MSPIEFKAPWSQRLKRSTAIAGALVILSAGVLLLTAPITPYLVAVIIGMVLGILILPTFFMVRGYTLTQDEILVRRLGRLTRLPLTGLQSVEGLATGMDHSWKVLGNGGLFVFAGWFWNKRLRLYRAFATDPSRAVVLRYAKRTIVITPHDPQHFIMRARTLLGSSAFRT